MSDLSKTYFVADVIESGYWPDLKAAKIAMKRAEDADGVKLGPMRQYQIEQDGKQLHVYEATVIDAQ